MKKYTEMTHEELLALKKELDRQYEEIKAQGLALDMSRGKPSQCAAGAFHGNDGRPEGRFRSEVRDRSRLP